MGKINVAVIGAGNISNTRHIPALRIHSDQFNICGVISDQPQKIKTTLQKYDYIKNSFLLDRNKDILEQLSSCDWFGDIEAVIIGTPPLQHYPMVRASLALGKHVLVEKPMMMTVEQCQEVKSIAEDKNLILYVMHSFQFSNGMIKLAAMFEEGKLGKLQSILELQLSNRDRRLPLWYNELPLGLFYDEAAHFFYGARRFGGKLDVLNAHAQFNKADDNTPKFLEVQMRAGETPVQMYMNFNSSICEWGLFLICDEKIAIYDYFKDILIVLKNDHQHYAKDVLRTSLTFSIQFWTGFIKNGVHMLSGKLLYGHDHSIKKWGEAILDHKSCFELSSDLGMEVVEAMNKVVQLASADKK